MKYRWLEEKLNCKELSSQIGIKVSSITEGDIVIGLDASGLPITRKGIEIELENETVMALEELDIQFQGLKREGSVVRNLAKELDELKAKIEKLERKVIR